MRSDLVVVLPPRRDNGAGVFQRDESVFIEALVAELPVESFDVGILGGLARLGQHQLHPVGLCPLIQRAAGELRSLIGPDGRGVSTKSADRLQDVCDALAVDATTYSDLDSFLGAIVDDRQTLDRRARGERVEDEVHGPGVIGPRWDLQWPALHRHPLTLAAFANGQAGLAVKAVHALVVDHEALPFDQDVQAAVAEAAAFAGQFHQPLLQAIVRPL